jgi:hypothetical protein
VPADEIKPAVVEAMEEIGLDLSREFPRPLTTDVVEAADVVVAMGCGDACPVFQGKRYLGWDLPDPAGKSIEQVRPIRDEINWRVKQLLDELVGTARMASSRSVYVDGSGGQSGQNGGRSGSTFTASSLLRGLGPNLERSPTLSDRRCFGSLQCPLRLRAGRSGRSREVRKGPRRLPDLTIAPLDCGKHTQPNPSTQPTWTRCRGTELAPPPASSRIDVIVLCDMALLTAPRARANRLEFRLSHSAASSDRRLSNSTSAQELGLDVSARKA